MPDRSSANDDGDDNDEDVMTAPAESRRHGLGGFLFSVFSFLISDAECLLLIMLILQ